jgi:hypothetical protein
MKILTKTITFAHPRLIAEEENRFAEALACAPDRCTLAAPH